MTTAQLAKRAVLSALGVYLYIFALVSVVFNAEKLFGSVEPGWLGPTLFLTIFVLSAAVTGSLVLLKPVMLYADGNRKDALRLFSFTVVALAGIALVVAVILVTTSFGR